MFKRGLLVIFALLLLVSLYFLEGCQFRRKVNVISGTRTYRDYIGSNVRFGVESGDIYGYLARDLFKSKYITEQTNVSDLLALLQRDQIDAVLVGHQYISQLISFELHDKFEYLWIPSDLFLKEASFVFHSEELRDKYNRWFEGAVSDGTYQMVINRWLDCELPTGSDIPYFDFSNSTSVIKVVDTGNYPPLSYQDSENNPIGFGTEMVSRFALSIGARLEYTFMPYETIVPFVSSGRADMSAATKQIDSERLPNVFYGSPALTTRAMLIVPRGQRVGLDIYDFIGQSVGVISGSHTMTTAKIAAAVPVTYQNTASAIEDVFSGKIFGFMDALSSLQATVSMYDKDVLKVVPVPKELFVSPVSAISIDETTIYSFNFYLEYIERTGLLESMHNRWFSVDFDQSMSVSTYYTPSTQTSAIQNLDDKVETLKVAISAEAMPYVFVNNGGEYSGFCVELALRYGDFIDKRVEFINMPFNELLPYIERGFADISIDRMGPTAERRSRVLFSNPFFNDQNGILVLRQSISSEPTQDDYTKFIGGRIGVSLGSLAEGVTKTYLRATPVPYLNHASAIEEIRRGRLDGLMTDLLTVNLMANLPENDFLTVYEVPSYIFNAPIGAFSTDQYTIDRFNHFLSILSRSGKLEELQERWLTGKIEGSTELTVPNVRGRNGILRVVTCGDEPPYSFLNTNGNLSGYCVELTYLFADYEDMIVQFTDQPFGDLIPFVVSGRADLGISCVSITEERAQSVIFSDPICYDTFGILALKEEIQTSVTTGNRFISFFYNLTFDNLCLRFSRFSSYLKSGFIRNFITDNHWKILARGFYNTVLITVLSLLFGTILGIIICYLMISRFKILRGISKTYFEILARIPHMVIMLIVFHIILAHTYTSNITIAVVAFSLIASIKITQALKKAYSNLNMGEVEEARALGLSKYQTYHYIIAPQILQRVIKDYTKSFVTAFKATAIVGYISVQDLTKAGDIIRSRTFDAYFPLFLVTLIYFLGTSFCIFLFKIIVRKVNKGGL